jgi:MFS family permease
MVLTAVGTLNYADRFLPGVLAEPIKNELDLSDTAIGLINGFGFVIVYAVLGIPIARIADRGAYGLVISGCLTLWGAMTMLGSVVQSGLQLVGTRVGVAIGEAGSTPAGHAYIARNFAPERRAAPLAVVTLSIPLSSAAALIGGGLLAQELGWRTAFLVLGGISVVLAPLALLVVGARQPVAAGPATPTTEPVGLRSLWAKRSYVAIVAGVSCISIAAYSLNTFAPAYLIRVHGMSVGEVGLKYGIVTGVAGVLGLLVLGGLADRLASNDLRWPLWLTAGMSAVLIPFSVMAFLVDSGVAALVFLGLSYIVGSAYIAPSIAAIQQLVPNALRATASAVLLFFAAVVGAVGPFVVGLISDALHADLGAAALGRALLFVVPATQALAIVFYLIAGRRFVHEVLLSYS